MKTDAVTTNAVATDSATDSAMTETKPRSIKVPKELIDLRASQFAVVTQVDAEIAKLQTKIDALQTKRNEAAEDVASVDLSIAALERTLTLPAKKGFKGSNGAWTPERKAAHSLAVKAGVARKAAAAAVAAAANTATANQPAA